MSFTNVTVCTFKLRKLESSYRGNATETSAWVYYIANLRLPLAYVMVNVGLDYIDSLGVGWLALLMLRVIILI